MNIYCDEAGFTGNKLRDAEQDVFAYATVAIHPSEAQEIVERARVDHRLQGKELKGSVLLKQERGRHAVDDILKRSQGNFKVVAHLKPYALTSKLFEYIFEPAVSNFNSFLYGINFHRFIATLLFLHLRVQNKPAEVLLDDFTRFVHKGDISALERLFPKAQSGSRTDSPLHSIGLFAQIHKDAIAQEILRFREPGVPNWILDLTTTSLFHLLAAWGEQYEELDVTCDESKPLKGDLPVFKAMVGRTEKVYIDFLGEEARPYTFNLAKPLTLAKSEDHAGIQIADIIAAVTARLFSNMHRGIRSPEDKPLIPLIVGHLHDSIWPSLEHADIDTPECFMNTVVLHELIDRSLAGTDLFDGLPALADFAYRSHRRVLRQASRRGSKRRKEKLH